MGKISIKDKKILRELDMDARMPLTQLAKRVGLSRQVIEYRIDRMQREQIILGARAVFDSAVVGGKWYRIAFRLNCVDQRQKQQVIDHLAGHAHTLWLGEVGGNWDIVVNFVCKDNFAFNEILEALIAEFGHLILSYEILIYINVYDQERSYICGGSHERKQLFHRMKADDSIKLDELDRKIMRELSKDAWVSNLQLGQKLGVTGNTIQNRIEGLRQKKILLGFRLFVNPSALGSQSTMLFLGINKLDLDAEKKFYAYVKSIPQVTFVVKHLGKWRFGMEIETKTVEEFQELFVDLRGRFADIISDYESFPIFKDHVVNYFPEGYLT